jgi:hypothetical protein
VIVFTSLLCIWKAQAAGRWYFVTVPDEDSAEIKAQAFASPRGFGSVRVEAAIRDVIWRTSVFPLNGGGYILPIKAKVRRDAGISAGDEVTVRLDLLV